MKPSEQWLSILSGVEARFTALANANGNLVSYATEVEYAAQIIGASDYLQKCPTNSILDAFVNVAAVGLTLSPAMKLAYLVPREGACKLDISYLGLIKIATDSGSVLAAKAEIVRQRDHFKYHGPFQAPDHDFDPFAPKDKRGDIIGCYTIARLHNGTDVVDTLNMEDIEDIRSVSKASREKANNPWQKWYEQMVEKSALKRGSKSWPKTDRMALAQAILNDHEGMVIDNGDGGAPRGKPARPNGAAIASATQAAPASEARDQFLAELETAVRANGQAHYEKLYSRFTLEQRRWLGKDGHERMWALGYEADQHNQQRAA